MSLNKSSNFLRFFSEAELNGKERGSYRFKTFLLDVAERRLFDSGRVIPLRPKDFDVLVCLVRKSGHLVEKEELMQSVWPDSFVEEANLTRIVHTLRKSLRQNDNGNKFIETVATKGYRFVAEVSEAVEGDSIKIGDQIVAAGASPDGTEIESFVDQNGYPAAIAAGNRARRKNVALAILGLLVVVSVGLMFAYRWSGGEPVTDEKPISIAIMPFRPVNVDTRDPAYEIGLADSLIAKLIPTSGLTIRPLSAIRDYTDVKLDAVAAGREQKVDYVLDSSYQVLNGRVRVASLLINVASGVVEIGLKSEADMDGSFRAHDLIVDELSFSILKRLGTPAADVTQTRGTQNKEAYRKYLQGMYLVDKRSPVLIEESLAFFDRAIELDPQYARAFAGRAYALRSLGILGKGDRHEYYVKAKDDVNTALRLDPNSSDAYTILGEIRWGYEGKFDEANDALRRAIEIDPGSAHARRFYSLILRSQERYDEAIEQINVGIDLDPKSLFGIRILGQILYSARRYDEAIAQLDLVRRMAPEFGAGRGMIWNSYLLKGDHENAFREFRELRIRGKADSEEITKYDAAYAESGFIGVLRETARIMEMKDGDANPEIYAQIGETDKALHVLEKMASDGGGRSGDFNVNPMLDPIRSDPRYKAILIQAGLK